VAIWQSICSRSVRNMNRCSTVEDAALQSEPERARLSSVDEPKLRPDAETILLVDDEDFVRKGTGEVLESAGYVVLTAKSAREALEIYDRQRGLVNLLLTDVILPGESGRTLAGLLRCRNPDLKVLFVSGYAEQTLSSNVDGESAECLPKPFAAQTILSKVRQVLDRSSRRKHLGRACSSQ
jgi:two-component system, cell cycle sensor histidine kinase and response regulator CckA